MHGRVAAALLLVVCATSATTSYAERELQMFATVSTGGSASASSSSGPTFAFAVARSSGGQPATFSAATSETPQAVDESIVDLLSRAIQKIERPRGRYFKGEFCRTAFGQIEEDMKGVGIASVSAYSNSLRGRGSACSNPEASAREGAKAYVDLLVDALIKGGDGLKKSSIEKKTKGMSDDFAQVFSSSFREICNEGGTASDELNSFAEDLIEEVATLVVILKANSDCSKVDEFGETEVNFFTDIESGEAEVNFFTDIESGEAVEASAFDVPEAQAFARSQPRERCVGNFITCCTGVLKRQSTCRCTISKNPRQFRCNARKVPGRQVIWEDPSIGYSCYCA